MRENMNFLGSTEDTSLFYLLSIKNLRLNDNAFTFLQVVYKDKEQEIQVTCLRESCHDFCTLTKQSN